MVRKAEMTEAMNLIEVGYTHSDGKMRELVASLPDVDYDLRTLKAEVDKIYEAEKAKGWDAHRYTRKAWLMAMMARQFHSPLEKKTAAKAIYWSDFFTDSTK